MKFKCVPLISLTQMNRVRRPAGGGKFGWLRGAFITANRGFRAHVRLNLVDGLVHSRCLQNSELAGSANAYIAAMLLFGIAMSIQLAPEIEAGLRAEAAARGMDVNALIAT